MMDFGIGRVSGEGALSTSYCERKEDGDLKILRRQGEEEQAEENRGI
jgi:hypothetical protein